MQLDCNNIKDLGEKKSVVKQHITSISLIATIISVVVCLAKERNISEPFNARL